MLAALIRAWLKKMRPKWSRSGKTSACRGRNAPPESTRYRHGRLFCAATSCARRCFFTVSGKYEPPLTVASFATLTHWRPSTTPMPVTIAALAVPRERSLAAALRDLLSSLAQFRHELGHPLVPRGEGVVALRLRREGRHGLSVREPGISCPSCGVPRYRWPSSRRRRCSCLAAEASRRTKAWCRFA